MYDVGTFSPDVIQVQETTLLHMTLMNTENGDIHLLLRTIIVFVRAPIVLWKSKNHTIGTVFSARSGDRIIRSVQYAARYFMID